MLSGFFRRALVAPLLLGTLLLPLGICTQKAHKSAHSCCASASNHGDATKRSCCTLRPPNPAILVAPSLSGSAQSGVSLVLLAQNQTANQIEFANRSMIVPRGSPPVASQLRI